MPPLRRAATLALRIVATAAHVLLKPIIAITRPESLGAHAVALTPAGKVILVRLRYAPGWRVPGGGRAKGEDPVEAALRELREEIGMVDHGEARLVRDFPERVGFRRDTASLVIVRDVTYRPHRWSWEVEEVREADPSDLPSKMSPTSSRWIASIGDLH